jgi:hypothetical protein
MQIRQTILYDREKNWNTARSIIFFNYTKKKKNYSYPRIFLDVYVDTMDLL